MPVPTIKYPEDVIVRVTLSALCRADQHTYSGKLGRKKTPWILGHEAIGIVSVVGSAVDAFKIGDIVVVPDAPGLGELRIQESTSRFGNI